MKGTERNGNDQWAPGWKPKRIKQLTDGVFAIAMTLLVFALSVPYFLGDGKGGDVPTSFGAMWGEFYVYFMCFVSLGIYWVVHDYIFHYIKRSDGILTWLNMVFLMSAALVPFSANMLNANELLPGMETKANAALMFFTINTIVTILILLVIWLYATGGKRLVDKDIDKRIVATLTKIMLIGPIIMVITVIISLFIPEAGYLTFIAPLFMIGMTAYGRFMPGFGRSVRKRG
jgi:uncharacterized membrane protein